jgi:hypothetical protein
MTPNPQTCQDSPRVPMLAVAAGGIFSQNDRRHRLPDKNFEA